MKSNQPCRFHLSSVLTNKNWPQKSAQRKLPTSLTNFICLYLGSDCTIHVFFFGDIELLTQLYRLSGLSGKSITFIWKYSYWIFFWTQFGCCWNFAGQHFCLKYLITLTEWKVSPLHWQKKPKECSWETLAEDLDSFTSPGASLDNAKHFNEVIAPAFLDISLDQVKLEATLISTGQKSIR